MLYTWEQKFNTMQTGLDSAVFAYHFRNEILDASVPIWAAMSFLRSPTVSSGLHFTRTLKGSEFQPNV